jgi:hypothetical protein
MKTSQITTAVRGWLYGQVGPREGKKDFKKTGLALSEAVF